MGPNIAEHRGVQIRYGYNIADDRYHAHFALPNKSAAQNREHGFSSVSTFTGILAGKQRPEVAESAEEVLKQAQAKIDSYFDE